MVVQRWLATVSDLERLANIEVRIFNREPGGSEAVCSNCVNVDTDAVTHEKNLLMHFKYLIERKKSRGSINFFGKKISF